MPSIPNYPYPESPGNAAKSVTLDSGVFNQLGASGARIGEAIEGLGALAHHIDQTYQEAAKTKAATSLSASGADALESLNDPNNPKNGDPDSYVPRVQDALNKASDKIEQDSSLKRLSPAMRLEWEAQKQKMNTETMTRAKFAAMNKRVDVAKGVFDVQEGNQIRNGDEEGALGTNDYMVAHGLRTAEQGAHQALQIPQQIDYGQAVKLMSMDSLTTNGGPKVAEQALTEQDAKGNFANYKRLTPEMREGLLRAARTNSYIEAAGFKNSLNATLANGYPQDPVAFQQYKEQVDTGLAKGLLTKGEAHSYMAPPKGEFDQNEEASLSVAAKTYDKSKDADGSKFAALTDRLSKPGINPIMRETLAAELKAGYEGKVGSTQKQIVAEAKNAFNKGDFVPLAEDISTPHNFGTPWTLWTGHEPAPNYRTTDWQKTAPTEYKQAATSLFNKYLTDMTAYFKAHETDNNGDGPTPLEADKYSQELMKPIHMSAVAAQLGHSLNTAIPSPSAAPRGAIEYLKAHPDMKDQFEAKYGKGSAAAALK